MTKQEKIQSLHDRITGLLLDLDLRKTDAKRSPMSARFFAHDATNLMELAVELKVLLNLDEPEKSFSFQWTETTPSHFEADVGGYHLICWLPSANSEIWEYEVQHSATQSRLRWGSAATMEETAQAAEQAMLAEAESQENETD